MNTLVFPTNLADFKFKSLTFFASPTPQRLLSLRKAVWNNEGNTILHLWKRCGEGGWGIDCKKKPVKFNFFIEFVNEAVENVTINYLYLLVFQVRLFRRGNIYVYYNT